MRGHKKNEEELFVATDSLYLIIFTPTAENPDHDSFMGSLPENYRLSYYR